MSQFQPEGLKNWLVPHRNIASEYAGQDAGGEDEGLGASNVEHRDHCTGNHERQARHHSEGGGGNTMLQSLVRVHLQIRIFNIAAACLASFGLNTDQPRFPFHKEKKHNDPKLDP